MITIYSNDCDKSRNDDGDDEDRTKETRSG